MLTQWHVAPTYINCNGVGFLQIMAIFLMSSINNACRSVSGVAERLQHTSVRCLLNNSTTLS